MGHGLDLDQLHPPQTRPIAIPTRVAIVSKENKDLNKPRGVKTLLSGLPAEVSALVKVLSRRK